jgi:mannose-6-phosphate isomerase-like protein (cupin superfamily)
VSTRQASDGEGRVQRAGGRHAIVLESGVRWERLTPNPDPGADFLYVVYDVGGSSSEGDRFIRHSGREYGLVLSGTLEVTVGFESFLLGPGDSICFDSTVPHRLRNVGDEPAHGVWFVIGRQSDEQRRFPLGDGDGGGPAA